MRGKLSILFVISIMLLFAFSCAVDPVKQESDYRGSGQPGGGSSVEIINKIWVESAGGYLQFKTNDRLNQGSSGRTFFYSLGSEATMSAFEADIIKVSGYAGSGAGLFFCASGSDSAGDLSGYFISIDTQGYYTIRALDRGTVQVITPWTVSAYLEVGLGKVNRLKVESLGANRFRLYINGVEVVTFPSDPAQFVKLTGGRYGYTVGVSAYEQFPAVSLDVKFKAISNDSTISYVVGG